MIQVNVNEVALSNMGFVIFLQEMDGYRALPIFIGVLEARSIAAILNDEPFPRPLTHDLFKNTLEALNAVLLKVEVHAVADSTFFGRLLLNNNGTTSEIDSRPSDAVALALRCEAPIFVAEDVMDDAGQNVQDLKPTAESSENGHEKTEIDLLREQLDTAVKAERYEEAARLRDRISELETQSNSN